MSAQPQPHRKYTVEEYIELLLNSDERFEYFDGEIVSMAGGKVSHSSISVNVAGELRSRLTSGNCQVFGSDAAIKTIRAYPFRYPDVSVVCGELQTESLNGLEMLLNPVLICEVLSPSTENYDREEKFLAYQAIESFQEYLLIEQHRPHVTQYLRQPDNKWLRSDIIGLDSELTLQSLGITLPLTEIYRMIKFPTLEAATPEPQN